MPQEPRNRGGPAHGGQDTQHHLKLKKMALSGDRCGEAYDYVHNPRDLA